MKNRTHQQIGLGFVLIILAGSLWAQVPAPPAPAAEPSLARSATKPHDASFVIGNDDLLAINVWKEPDISRSIPVRSDGRISLPLVGELQATGRTPLQLEAGHRQQTAELHSGAGSHGNGPGDPQ